MRFSVACANKISLVMLLLCILGLGARVEAQVVACSPGPGGPPPGSVPRAITIAPPLAILPNVPIPGTWLWVLYENRHLMLLHLPVDWPATPANQVITMNLDTLPGFGIPASYELYDLATGPGNIGLGIFYTSAWLLGRNPATGERRVQRVGLSPGAPPGGCFTAGAAQVLNPGPAAIGAVLYPQDYITNTFWSLGPANGPLEPGTSTPDQMLTFQNIASGLASLAPVDEDQIICAPGVNCPNWNATLMEQMTGDAVHLLLRTPSTGAQSVGWLNLGNAGFGGFNGCAGSVNPCLYQRVNLPAPLSGNTLDIAGYTYIPHLVWVLWAEGLASASAAPEDVEAGNGLLASTPSTVTYKLGAITGSGALLGSLNLAEVASPVTATFADVPPSHWAWPYIEALYSSGITNGCATDPLRFCPEATVTREQMAAFIIRLLGDFNPPRPALQRFLDVPPSNPFYAFIEQMALRQITLGCGGGNYCPKNPVTREQMAAFIIRAIHPPGYVPPLPEHQRFLDVPPSNPFYAYINELGGIGITTGCGGGNYCPTQNVTREQMAVFLVRAGQFLINNPR